MHTSINPQAQEEVLRRPETAHFLCNELLGRGARRVILLGVPAVMNTSLLKTPIAKAGLMVFTPSEADRSWIGDIAEHELRQDKATPETLQRFASLIASGADHGIDHLVIASTELMSLAHSCELPIPIVDALRAGASEIQNVIFDAGRVLLTWEPLVMARHVCDSEEDAQLLARELFESPKWAQQDAGAIDDETLCWITKLHVPTRLHDAVEKLVYHWHDNRTTIPHTDELIRELKQAGYGVYLLSDASFSFEHYERELPAYDCFDGMVVSCYEGVCKPDARIYRTLCERYGIQPERCLFIDDTELNVIGARRIGMQGWHFDGSVDLIRYHFFGDQGAVYS